MTAPRATTAASRLQATLDLGLGALVASTERIWTSAQVRELYPAYLVTMHGITRSAAPLLEAARDRAEALAAEGDPVAPGLVAYFAHHAPEEAGHDRWILEDLEALGHDPTEPLRTMPSPAVAELVGAQYYWLRHHHPVCLLGHMAVVEGNPPRPGFAARLQQLTGFPAEAFRTVARHERLDVAHSQELFATIDALPLTREHESMMGLSGLHTIRAATTLFDQIALRARGAA